MNGIDQKNVFTLCVTRICIESGISNLPDKTAMDYLFSFFMKFYSDFTSDNFLYAFELNTIHAYNKKYDHFQLFSRDYIADVLNAFRRLQQLAEKSLKAIIKQPETQVSQELIKEAQIQWLKDIISDFYSDENTEIKFPVKKYEILDQFRIIKFSNEDKKSFMDRAKAMITDEKGYNMDDRDEARKLKRIIDEINNDSITAITLASIIRNAKLIALRQFFSDIRKKGEKIEDYLGEHIKKIGE